MGFERAVQALENRVQGAGHLPDFVLTGRGIESRGEVSRGNALGSPGNPHHGTERPGRQPVTERRGCQDAAHPDRPEQPGQAREMRIDFVAVETDEDGVRLLADRRGEDRDPPVPPPHRDGGEWRLPAQGRTNQVDGHECRLVSKRRRCETDAAITFEDLHELLGVVALRQSATRDFVQVNVQAINRGGELGGGDGSHFLIEVALQIGAEGRVDREVRDGQQQAEGERPRQREPGPERQPA